MPSYSVRDVERVLQLSPATTRGLIRAGFVKPARGPRREYRFSFQDLIVLRTARALIEAQDVAAKRIRRSLERLRRELPASVPLSGLAISAVGDHVVVRDGEARWQAEGGQYVLGLDVSAAERRAARGGAPRRRPRPRRRGATVTRLVQRGTGAREQRRSGGAQRLRPCG